MGNLATAFFHQSLVLFSSLNNLKKRLHFFYIFFWFTWFFLSGFLLLFQKINVLNKKQWDTILSITRVIVGFPLACSDNHNSRNLFYLKGSWSKRGQRQGEVAESCWSRVLLKYSFCRTNTKTSPCKINENTFTLENSGWKERVGGGDRREGLI